jgi:hypothetical protein
MTQRMPSHDQGSPIIQGTRRPRHSGVWDEDPAQVSPPPYRIARASLPAQQTAPIVRRQRRPLHGTVYIGLTLLCMLVGFVVFSALSTWWQHTEGQGEDPLPEQDGQSPQRQDDEQDRLPSVPEEEEEEGKTPPAPPQPDEPNGPEPTPPPRDPRPLSLPVVAARAPRSFPLLVAGTLGISSILLGVALGLLLATNPTSLGPVIAWLPGITPTASVTLTPAEKGATQSQEGDNRPQTLAHVLFSRQ